MTNSTAIDMLAPDNWAYPSSTPVSPYAEHGDEVLGAMLFEVEQQMVGEWLETVVLCASCSSALTAANSRSSSLRRVSICHIVSEVTAEAPVIAASGE